MTHEAPNSPKRLRKELSLLGVYTIATGTTLSAGFFLLPGFAVAEAGSAIVLAYAIAAIPMIPAMLSAIELATAMPRAGGAYYFLDRSLGPLVGTIGGIGTWAALVLKTAFALVGMGAYLVLVLPDSAMHMTKPIAALLAVLFGVLNLMGARSSGRAQIWLVFFLLAILAWFCSKGVLHVQIDHFENFFGQGFDRILATAGMVYISYVGITKVASVSEEVKNPERNLPLGVMLSFGTVLVIYAVGTFVMVGVQPPGDLAGDHTPVATVARTFAGKWGEFFVVIAALLAFASVVNAGIMSSSRYPLAMARDHLLPARFRQLGRRGTPVLSIFVSVAAVLLLLFIDPVELVKLASSFQLLIFALLCLAVIVMRESRIDSYDPGYRTPFYPWMQIVGIVVPFWLIGEMGWLPIGLTFLLIGAGAGWYVYYGRPRVVRHGAIFHIFERLGRRRYAALDSELRGILKEKGLRATDPFEEVVARSIVLQSGPGYRFEDLVILASDHLARTIGADPKMLRNGFMEGTRVGATPVAGGVALPHTRVAGIERPYMAIARIVPAITIMTDEAFGSTKESEPISAIFFLVSPAGDPGQHLRLLASLAEQVDQEEFLEQWIAARGDQELRHTLLRSDHSLTLTLLQDSQTEPMIDVAVRDLNLPKGCLIVMVHREDATFVPEGGTILMTHDYLTVVGSIEGITALRARYTAQAAAPPDDDDIAREV
ncbi:MAG: amino acid permease [Planctomycetes bacterium]|nr:amino acid permease [Planctomycetota bacterium]NOG53014.1 amino acid permease [Planctomycetota bacterium]